MKQVLGGKPRFQSFLGNARARPLFWAPLPFTLSRVYVIPKSLLIMLQPVGALKGKRVPVPIDLTLWLGVGEISLAHPI